MNPSVKRFKEVAAQEKFKGWPLVGEPQLGPKIPFFGQTLNYQLQTGNGVEPYTSILRHFGWAVCFGLTTENEVITLCQWKPGINQASWELPPGSIGKISSSATIEEITERTKESYLKETGFGGGQFTYLGHILVETGKYRGAGPGEHGLPGHLFMAEGLEKVQEARNPNPNEIMETIMVPLRDFRKVLESGLFVEASAVPCAHEALIHLGCLRWS